MSTRARHFTWENRKRFFNVQKRPRDKCKLGKAKIKPSEITCRPVLDILRIVVESLFQCSKADNK